jgi:hypothetical protein
VRTNCADNGSQKRHPFDSLGFVGVGKIGKAKAMFEASEKWHQQWNV